MANINVQPTGQPAAVRGLVNATSMDLSQVSDVSLHLDGQDIASVVKSGDNLIVVLSNGEEILLENFFVADGSGSISRLFISENGLLQSVEIPIDSGLSAVRYVVEPLTAQNAGLVF